MLDSLWMERGPLQHWYEAVYRRYAHGIVTDFALRLQAGAQINVRHPMKLELHDRTLQVVADEMEVGPPPTFRRHHFGRAAKTHSEDHRLSLMSAAHIQVEGRTPHNIRLIYPLSDEPAIDAMPTERVIQNRTRKMMELIRDIEAGKFVPKPSGENCPNCPYNLICPA